MNTHYIPRLLLRPFATGEKINSYDFSTESFYTKKLKHTFAENDLYDSELEKAFASKMEGPVGNLLNNKLLAGKTISMDRKENMLLRKFLMMNFLRSPIVNQTWDDMVEKMQMQDHPSVQTREFLLRQNPELKEYFEKGIPSKDSFVSDLKLAMEYDTLERMLAPENVEKISMSLQVSAQHAMVTAIAFWDSEESGQEFILPKLPGVSMMDQVSVFHKSLIIRNEKTKIKNPKVKECLKFELNRLEYGSMLYSENFSIYPISPTRVLICFSPYFRAFFPFMDFTNTLQVYPPLLDQAQFDRHFFEPMRMELFRPCETICNKFYRYDVKSLTAEEVMQLNALLLNLEMEEFVFHDYNKIRDSFWYYDKKARFAMEKRHNFCHIEN